MIEVLEVSRGHAPGPVPTLAGLLLGTAVGFALGCAANRDDYGVYCGGQSDATVLHGRGPQGPGGAAGALLFRREQWAAVALPPLR